VSAGSMHTGFAKRLDPAFWPLRISYLTRIIEVSREDILPRLTVVAAIHAVMNRVKWARVRFEEVYCC
jgi:hypothetical protein